MRKFDLILSMFMSALLATTVAAQKNTLLVSERFNDSNSKVQMKNGAVVSNDSSGVSGKSGDKAYISEVKKLDDPAGNPAALLSETPQVQGLEEMTVAFWYKPGERQAKDASLFNAASMYLIGDGKGGWTLRVEAQAEKGVQYWFNTGNKGPYVEWSKPNEWIYAAFAWKKSTGEVCFYQGTKKDSSKLQRCQKRPETVGALKQRAETDKRLDVIGNTLDAKYNRPFNGSIDNFRVYAKALDKSAVEKIREADLKNENPPQF